MTAATADLARSGQGSPTAPRHLLHDGRKLLLLLTLADTRAVSSAAAALGIGQAGASMALARIEAALGFRLFHRGLQGMTPTDPASRLLLRARRIRAELRHAASELASAEGAVVGAAVIGTLPMARADLLPRAIGTCLARAPGIQAQMVEAPAEILVARLRSGEIDAVVTVPGPGFEPKGLVVEPLLRDEMAVLGCAGHPLASAGPLTLREVSALRWILPWRSSMNRALFEARFIEEKLPPPRPAVQAADLSMIRGLLAASDMVAFISLRLFQFEIDAGLLAPLDLGRLSIEREVALVRREGASLSLAAEALIAEIRGWGTG
ncbi:LysR family transcriptional regulator [Amaricoccus solimangrovi]|uniref:LysR family transcriptional regulator n=1 Tax=Amaricoccus solimangrovi TaxID=2589815 RepID=UPI001F3F7416|nr:LysR family transcriptional regulator [Amaricoccus solimangrovi]